MKKILLVSTVAFLAIYLTALVYIGFYTSYDNAKPSDAILVLGAASEYKNMVNPCLLARVEKGVSLYKKKYASKMIMSGGNDGYKKNNQAILMGQLAEKRGIPKKDILLETESGSTYENLLYTKRIMEENDILSVIIVSDPYHLARALLVARTLHINATVSPASESPCWSKYQFLSFDYLRDGFAMIAYILTGKIALVSPWPLPSAYSEIISPLVGSIENMGLMPKKESAIDRIVTSVLSQREGEYAIFYKDLATEEEYTQRAHMVYPSASLYKLWIMGEAFRQIDVGAIKKEDVLKESVENLNKKFNIASESAERKDGDVELSVEDALEKMIIVSDNYAALLLSAKIRLSGVSNFLTTNGFVESTIGVPPKTSAYDIGRFFEKLYKGEMGGQLYSKEMLAILGRQRLNDRLPKYLPDSVIIAHKTGELDGYKHDGGIIYAAKGPYILVVLSKSDDLAYAAETIALVSKAVYEMK